MDTSGSEEKEYISPMQMYHDAFALAHAVYLSGFKPDFIIALWRGGTPAGIIIQEYLAYRGIPTDHIAVRTSAYEGERRKAGAVAVHGLNYVSGRVGTESRLLLVDDVYDSGASLKALVKNLKKRTGPRFPREVRSAVLYRRPGRAEGPDFFIHESSRWLVFPHELSGLKPEEILRFKDPCIHEFFIGAEKC